VTGVLLADGRFEGRVADGDDIYFIERAEHVVDRSAREWMQREDNSQ